MKVNFSKMTQKKYEQILNLRESLNQHKRKLALQEIEINSLNDFEDEFPKEFAKIKKGNKKLLKKINKLSERLKPFEI